MVGKEGEKEGGKEEGRGEQETSGRKEREAFECPSQLMLVVR